jgi:hypothetical protein
MPLTRAARSIREEAIHVHCGRGSWGGRRLSLADYVMGTGPRGEQPLPEGASVLWYPYS